MKTTTKIRIFGLILILLAALLAGTVAYRNSQRRQSQVVFSTNALLSSLWNSYKLEYVEPGSGRTLDKQQANITTSEGQSYTMLRAVWMDDKATFDKSWEFTKHNLQRPSDNLFAWRYGSLGNGQFGVLTDQGGQNTAGDADQDIALALIFASERWGQPGYLADAKPIINSIWEHEVVVISGRPYLAANQLEKGSTSPLVIVNPSYLSPHSYRAFAQVDKTHDWTALIDTSYLVIQQSTDQPLDKQSSAKLAPNWIGIDRQTGELKPLNTANLTTEFGYDALRLPWRLALDYKWHNEPRAKAALERFSFLKDQYTKTGSLMATYTHDGQAVANYEAPAMYGGTIGYFMVTDPELAETVYRQKLQSLYDVNSKRWKQPLSYYDDNWTWFGIALHEGGLYNLAPSQQ